VLGFAQNQHVGQRPAKLGQAKPAEQQIRTVRAR
jgi:hypothetical protein